MKVQCYESLEAAAFLRAHVNALNMASSRPDPFSTFEFFENYLKHNEDHPRGRGMRLWFLAAFDKNGLAGYLALKQVPHKVMGVWTYKIDFLATHNTDRPQVVARPEQARAVGEAFYAYLLERRDWSFLEFRQQDSASVLFPPPPVHLKGCRVCEWPSLENGTIPVSWDSLNGYFKSFSKKFRSNTGRQVRSLLAAGNLEYIGSSDPRSTGALFELYRCIEPRSWKARAGVGIGRHPQWVDYYQGLLDRYQPMRVSVHVLMLDGVPIAGLITGAFQNGLYALHIVYDDSLSRLGPGSAILLMGMRQAIDGGYAFFNLLSGFGYYKLRWQARMTPARHVQIYRIGTPFYWRRLLGDLRRGLLRTSAPRQSWLFNPLRREVLEQDPESEIGVVSKPRLAASEQERIQRLVAQARHGRSEYISGAQWAAILPFSTQRPAREPNTVKSSARPAPARNGYFPETEMKAV